MIEKYQFLERESSPRIVKEMTKLYGIKEVQGEGDNPVILDWAKEIGEYLGAEYIKDETPWCGLVMGIVAKRAKFEPPKMCLRARAWVNFGNRVLIPELGSIVVFVRAGGGGHVGLYVAEDESHYHILGGNQGDAVSIVRIDKQRLWAVRECPWKLKRPDSVRRIFMDTTGQISQNED